MRWWRSCRKKNRPAVAWAAAWVGWAAWAAWICNKRASASRSLSLRMRSGVQFREKAPFTRGFFAFGAAHAGDREIRQGDQAGKHPARLSGEDYLGMTIFASLTTIFHFAVSLLIRSRNSSGGPPASSSPSRASQLFIVSVFSTLATSRFQRMTISLGMPLGPHIPYQ